MTDRARVHVFLYQEAAGVAVDGLIIEQVDFEVCYLDRGNAYMISVRPEVYPQVRGLFVDALGSTHPVS